MKPVLKLAIELADDHAQINIQSYCAPLDQEWYDTSVSDDMPYTRKSLRYLELRGLLIRKKGDRKVVTFTTIRRCRKCGCTDRDGCDEGCEWVGKDQCSACKPAKRKAA